MANFQDRFKELKAQKNVTYQNLADRLKIGVRAVQRYAEGRGYPDFLGLVELADCFGVSIDYLVGKTDTPSPPVEVTLWFVDKDSKKRPFFMLGANSFSQRMMHEMMRKGVTREDVAEGIGVRNLDAYNTMFGAPPTDIVKKLAKYFDVSMDYLLGNTNDPDAGSTDYVIGESIINENTDDVLYDLLSGVMNVRNLQTDPTERRRWEIRFKALQQLMMEHQSFEEIVERMTKK